MAGPYLMSTPTARDRLRPLILASDLHSSGRTPHSDPIRVDPTIPSIARRFPCLPLQTITAAPPSSRSQEQAAYRTSRKARVVCQMARDLKCHTRSSYRTCHKRHKLRTVRRGTWTPWAVLPHLDIPSEVWPVAVQGGLPWLPPRPHRRKHPMALRTVASTFQVALQTADQPLHFQCAEPPPPFPWKRKCYP